MHHSSFDDPYIDSLGKYPVKFAVPVFFGESPTQSYAAQVNSATATLLRLGNRYLGITCSHVVAGFRGLPAARRGIFQIGQMAVSIDSDVISEDPNLDLAVFDLTRFLGRDSGAVAANFICPAEWPPKPVAADDVLCLAGFPGMWRQQADLGLLRFYSFSSGATGVLSVTPDTIKTRIEVEECIVQIHHGHVLGSLGGLSGGPVFAWRRGLVLTAELVGFIYEYQESLDVLLIRAAGVIGENGTLLG